MKNTHSVINFFIKYQNNGRDIPVATIIPKPTFYVGKRVIVGVERQINFTTSLASGNLSHFQLDLYCLW